MNFVRRLWHRRRARRTRAPFPEAWFSTLREDVAHYALLDEDERARLRRCVAAFVSEKHWEGCGGLHIDDRIRVVIAAQACYLAMGLAHDAYRRLKSILVYPSAWVDPRGRKGFDGLDTSSPRLGEAWPHGPVILSWRDAQRAGRRIEHGRNVVFHEFAHHLDMSDAMHSTGSHDVLQRAYRTHVEQTRLGRTTLLDPYGATNEIEFFAVATECFFERPAHLRNDDPHLYEMLRRCYRQDPARREEAIDRTGT